MGFQARAWIVSILFGLIGIAISAAIFFGIMVATERVFGIVAIFTGAIAGGLAGIGYKIGGGTFRSKEQASTFLGYVALVGLVAVLAAFTVGPYFYIADGTGDFFAFLELYNAMGGFSLIDILFVAIGAYGGYWAGSKAGYSIAVGQAQEETMKRVRQDGLKQVDQKFK